MSTRPPMGTRCTMVRTRDGTPNSPLRVCGQEAITTIGRNPMCESCAKEARKYLEQYGVRR